jgi:F0F1-type ATP synthase assembly protein I
VTDTTITASVCHAMNGHGDAREAPRSQQSLKLDGMNEGMRVLSYLISGVLFYGFLGWLGDHFLGTNFLLPIGIVAGAALGCYVIIRRVGRVEDSPPAAGARPVSPDSMANAEEGPR